MVCTASLGLCYALPHWGTVFSTAPLGCVLHCPLWGCDLYCLSGNVFCTASLRLCSVLPLWAMVCTASLGLCHALPLLGTVLCSAPLWLFPALPL